MIEKFKIKAVVELEYFVKGINEDCKMLERLEESELELMLDKSMADCTYVDNQSCRFNDVKVVSVKVSKVKGVN